MQAAMTALFERMDCFIRGFEPGKSLKAWKEA